METRPEEGERSLPPYGDGGVITSVEDATAELFDEVKRELETDAVPYIGGN